MITTAPRALARGAAGLLPIDAELLEDGTALCSNCIRAHRLRNADATLAASGTLRDGSFILGLRAYGMSIGRCSRFGIALGGIEARILSFVGIATIFTIFYFGARRHRHEPPS